MQEFIQEPNLSLEELLSCFTNRYPRSAIHFRELLHHARFRRPFQLKGVANYLVGLKMIGPIRPCANQLAARLLKWVEWLERTFSTTSRFFREFPKCRSERIIALDVFALADRPRAIVFVRPKRAAGVNDKHLQPPANK